MSIVTRDIIKDLLPLYVAGEVSAESRAAVENALRNDAELREMAAALGDPAALRAAPVPSEPARDALRRVKRRLRLRTWVTAMATPGVLLPFSFGIDKGGVHWLYPDSWMRLAPIAVACLVLIVMVNRPGRVGGL